MNRKNGPEIPGGKRIGLEACREEEIPVTRRMFHVKHQRTAALERFHVKHSRR